MKRVAGPVGLLVLLGVAILIARGSRELDPREVDPLPDGRPARDSSVHAEGMPEGAPVLRGAAESSEAKAHPVQRDDPGPSEEPTPVPDPHRAPVADLIEALSSEDIQVRRAAAERIVEAGYFAIERFARHGSSLDTEAWQAFADAVLEKAGQPDPARALVAAAHAAPGAHRRRLIALAQRLDAEAMRTPTQQETEEIVRREFVEQRGLVDDDPGGAVVICGHAAMPVVLELLEEGPRGTVDLDRAGSVMSAIAQPEDIPALRELLLEGVSCAATALGRLDALGYTEALDAMIEAVRSGRFDGKMSAAVRRTSNPRRAARAVREWIQDRGRSLTEGDRVRVAGVLAALGSRTDIPLLEAWSSSPRSEGTLLALGRALTKLGSAKGLDLLVRIVEEKKVDPTPGRGPMDTGRLDAGGFGRYERWVALRSLNAVAVQLSGSEGEEGPWKGVGRADLDHVAPEVRAWWEGARDRIQFDEKAGAWRLESD